MKLHIIYTAEDVLLSKQSYASWHEIQDEYKDYKSSLGPWEEDEIVQYLAEEYFDLEPTARVKYPCLHPIQKKPLRSLFEAGHEIT